MNFIFSEYRWQSVKVKVYYFRDVLTNQGLESLKNKECK